MIPLVKFLIIAALSFSGHLLAVDHTIEGYEPILSSVKSNITKQKAFSILDSKCNICHSKRNKRRVFTLQKMDAWADEVYVQVFVKKRMPKGKNIKLTTQEYQDLLSWISTTKITNDGIKL